MKPSTPNYHCGEIFYDIFREKWKGTQTELAKSTGRAPNYFSDLWRGRETTTKKVRQLMESLDLPEFYFYLKLFPELTVKGSTLEGDQVATGLKDSAANLRGSKVVQGVPPKTMNELIRAKDQVITVLEERADMYKELYLATKAKLEECEGG